MALQLPMTDIRAFCKRWRVTEFSLFGSALREEFSDSSDGAHSHFPGQI
jgi:uncharacterized protein